MNCREIQDILLQSEAPQAPQPAAVGEHLRECESCRAFGARLARLEQIVRELPACGAGPTVSIQNSVLAPRRRGWRMGARRMAIAAVLLIGLGLGAWIFQATRPIAGPEMIQQLAAWNVELAEERSLDNRVKSYSQSEARLRRKMERARLSPSERKLAENLLDNGAWMARHADELAAAERFDAVAQRLIDHMDAAAAQGTGGALDQFGGTYCMVVNRGFKKNLSRVEGAAVIDPEQKSKLTRVNQRHAETQKKLKNLVDRSPAASRKKILNVLDRTAKGSEYAPQ